MDSPLAIAEVKPLFHRDPDGACYLRGSFVNYSIDLPAAINHGVVASTAASQVTQALRHVSWDLWNIGSLIARLEWTDEVAKRGELSTELWRQFCSLDIEHFHVELRSILDYAALCIAASADRPATVSHHSMNDLLGWLDKKPGNRVRLGEDLASLLKKVPSFPDIKSVRDETVHRGAFTLVFEKPGAGIIFQVHNRFFRRLIRPEVSGITSGNVVDFRRYASLLIAENLLFLEQLADTVRSRIPVDHIGIGDARMEGPGWDVFSRWLDTWDAEGWLKLKPASVGSFRWV